MGAGPLKLLRQNRAQNDKGPAFMPVPSECCGSLQDEPMGIRGLEHTPLAGSEPRFPEGASQNAAHSDPFEQSKSDPALARVVAVWDELKVETRASIMKLLDLDCG